MGPATDFTLRRLACFTRVSGSGQHSIFTGDPPLRRALQKRWHRIGNTGGTEHPRVTELNQAAPFGVEQKIAVHFDRPELHESTPIITFIIVSHLGRGIYPLLAQASTETDSERSRCRFRPKISPKRPLLANCLK